MIEKTTKVFDLLCDQCEFKCGEVEYPIDSEMTQEKVNELYTTKCDTHK